MARLQRGGTMNLLIKNADLYAPAHRGRNDILVCSGIVAAIAESLDTSALPFPCEILDAGGMRVVPGFIDGHVHITGGGGEGGFDTRTPELSISDTIRSGVTTVVGVLGTDGVTRSVENLVAKTYAIREAGLSAWCLTGSYRLPLVTVTGDACKDIMMVEPIIGIGEVAVSDHRSSKPSVEELARIAAEARVAGMLSGKAGIVNVHMGDAPAGFAPLEAVVAAGDLPRTQFLPTHCSRNRQVFEQALRWAGAGGWVDFTASGTASGSRRSDGELSAARAIIVLLEKGLSLARATLSSDGQGSLPVFDESGRLRGLTVGSCASLGQALREMVRDFGLPLEEALVPLTLSPARAFQFSRKGRLEVNSDADAVVLDAELRPSSVIARGRILVRFGKLEYRDAFVEGESSE